MIFVISQVRFWGSLGGVIFLCGCISMNKGIPPRSGSPLNHGVSRYNRGDTEGAIEAYDQAIFLEPKSSKAPYNLGLILLQQGQSQKRLRHSRRPFTLIQLLPAPITTWASHSAKREI